MEDNANKVFSKSITWTQKNPYEFEVVMNKIIEYIVLCTRLENQLSEPCETYTLSLDNHMVWINEGIFTYIVSQKFG